MENKKIPHLYLDMDGVQADFFGAWSKRTGVQHWKAIADKEKEINELAHSDPEQVYRFFRDLEPLSGGMKVIAWLQENNINYTILSAPLRGPYYEASIKAKREWLVEHHPNFNGNAIFVYNKAIYAITNDIKNVLVDDYGKYLNAWDIAGGIAVKHEDEYEDPDTATNTINQLKEIYNI